MTLRLRNTALLCSVVKRIRRRRAKCENISAGQHRHCHRAFVSTRERNTSTHKSSTRCAIPSSNRDGSSIRAQLLAVLYGVLPPFEGGKLHQPKRLCCCDARYWVAYANRRENRVCRKKRTELTKQTRWFVVKKRWIVHTYVSVILAFSAVWRNRQR